MKDDPLDKMLQALPRERAPEDFTDQVLSRWPQRQPARPAARRWLRTAAVTMVLVGLISSLAFWWWKDRQAAVVREQLALLRAEASELRAELSLWQHTPPIYMGGDEKVDYVLDPVKLWGAAPPHAENFVRPASYTGGSI